MEVKIISDYLKPNMPLPQYLPYARFLLNTDLSHTAKLLYTLLLDRATLSQKNNWVDEQGRIYVIYPLSNLAKDLGCCVSSVTRSFAELEKAELAEQVRYGFSTPSHILLKVPHTVQNCAVTVCTSAQHECAETHSMIMQKCTPNQRNKNNLKDNHLIKTTDAYLTFGEYQNVFLTEKEYNQLKADFSGLDDLIEQSVALVGKPVAMMTKDDKIRAIQFLNNAGAFLVTKSGDKVSKHFGISKYTLYSYIDAKKDS